MRSAALVLLVVIAGVAVAACASRGARADLAGQVASFQDYPILWLGPAYDVDSDGKPDDIAFARRELSPAVVDPDGKMLLPARRSFSIAYGTCEIPPGAEGCPIPLNLVFEAPCEAPRLSAKNGTARVRGIDADVQVQGYLRLETADVTVTIATTGTSLDEITRNSIRIANALQPANAKAKAVLAAGGDFRPKGAAQCAGVTPGIPPDVLPYLTPPVPPPAGPGMLETARAEAILSATPSPAPSATPTLAATPSP